MSFLEIILMEMARYYYKTNILKKGDPYKWFHERYIARFIKELNMPKLNLIIDKMQKQMDASMLADQTGRVVDQTVKTRAPGGIDFKSDKVDSAFAVKMDSRLRGNDNAGIKFNIDPTMLEQLQNAPGFVPVIINIQPMNDLSGFLGLNEHSPAPSQATVAL